MQLDSSKARLNELQNRLIDSMLSILKTNKTNLDKTSDKFKFSSKNYLFWGPEFFKEYFNKSKL